MGIYDTTVKDCVQVLLIYMVGLYSDFPRSHSTERIFYLAMLYTTRMYSRRTVDAGSGEKSGYSRFGQNVFLLDCVVVRTSLY